MLPGRRYLAWCCGYSLGCALTAAATIVRAAVDTHHRRTQA